MKERLICDDFVHAIAAARRQVAGTVKCREWSSISRWVNSGDDTDSVPPGIYACVEFVVIFDDERTGREVVSFRLDDDGVWRFVGDHFKACEGVRL